jgi:ElaB/YqjD/DUF883 family membrane-anchored ribosome-binding protein
MSETEQLRRDVEDTRADLGDTVEELSQKADLKAQAKQKIEERKAALRGSRVAHTAEEKPFPAIGVAFGAGVVLGWLITRS